ncbi:type II toxin-antitoxin system HicB family antitoxin [Xenorhabdus sp. Vera]|uniref:type II toxin-antitoxin system HicB family antitoxin n=1 Tax=Xenorhabdus koppenhoeferi TaxID=351659 RepID=UPI0019B4FCA2|nr:type II toxin-antitoxin system HicB family antitoxin [Xenorhabdus sp. Vera]MBD2811768.1 type II toxin-antitoxin system HicB family antitoxin [Xenorhabdus sp. Vera]
MYYPAKFAKEDNSYTVSFNDIPEAMTCGADITEAMEMAEDVLLSCVEVYFDMDKAFPSPASELQADEMWVYLPDNVYAKVLLNNVLIKDKVSKAELSRLTGIRPPEIQRILTPRHATKIDTISKAISALGKRLLLSVN